MTLCCRVFATALSEEVVKPLKQMIDNQHRTRKAIETAVDKTGIHSIYSGIYIYSTLLK